MARSDFPDARGIVLGGRREQITIGTKCDIVDRFFMRKSCLALTSGDLPDLGNALHTRGSQTLAIRAEDKLVNLALVCQHNQAASTGDLPERDELVFGASIIRNRRQKALIGTEKQIF